MHFHDEIERHLQVEAQFALKDKMPFFVCPYTIKEEQKTVVEKETNQLEKKMGMLTKEITIIVP